MSAGYHQHLFTAQKFVVQQLRQRTEWNALVEYMLQLWVAPRNRVTDDNQVGLRIKISGVEWLRNRNAKFSKKFRHRRIRGGVRSSHAKPALLQHSRQRRHCRPTNTN